MTLLSTVVLTTLAALLACCWTMVPGIHVYSALLLVQMAWYLLPLELPQSVIVSATSAMLAAGAVTSVVPSLLVAPADGAASRFAELGRDAVERGSAPAAILLAAAGSVVGLLLLGPCAWLAHSVGTTVWTAVRGHLHWILGALIVYLCLSGCSSSGTTDVSRRERLKCNGRSVLVCLLCILLSGALGWVALSGVTSDWSHFGRRLLPVFMGLFGLPVLVAGIALPSVVPPQSYGSSGLPAGQVIYGGLRGVAAGTAAAFLPGVPCGTAALLSGRPNNSRSGLIALGALRSSYYVGGFLLLHIAPLTAHRGAQISLCTFPHAPGAPPLLLLAVGGAALGGAIAIHLLPHLLHALLRFVKRFGVRRLHQTAICIALVTVFLIDGSTGLAHLAIATAIGLLPVVYGFNRLCLLAAALLPLTMRLAGAPG